MNALMNDLIKDGFIRIQCIIAIGLLFSLSFQCVHFSSLDFFLMNDKTDEHPYTDEYKCFNFTLALIENATREGFTCFFTVVKISSRYHSICCFKTDEGLRFVEPQTDEILWMDSRQPYWILREIPHSKYVVPCYFDNYSL